MTVKDLHFSFDSALAQAQVPAANQAAPAAPQGREPAAGTPARAARNRVRNTKEASARRAWITASFVSLVNMAFLVLAALWLTGSNYQVPGLPGFVSPILVPPIQGRDPGPALHELQSGLDATVGQLADLEGAVAAQSEMLTAIQAQLDRAREPREVPVVAAAAAPPPVEDLAPVAEDWQINLGSFSSLEDAMNLQAELASIGYAAQVGRPSDPGETAYRVWLGGYENRAAADTVAHKLMAQTSLTGLWVWDGR